MEICEKERKRDRGRKERKLAFGTEQGKSQTKTA